MQKHASYVRCTIEWAGLKKLTCVPSWLHNSHYREAYAQQLVHLETQAAATKQELQTSKLITQAFVALLPHGLVQGFLPQSLSLLTKVEIQERPWQGHGKRSTFSGKPKYLTNVMLLCFQHMTLLYHCRVTGKDDTSDSYEQALNTVSLFFPLHVTGQAGPGLHLETRPTRNYLHVFHQKPGDLCSRPEGRKLLGSPPHDR